MAPEGHWSRCGLARGHWATLGELGTARKERPAGERGREQRRWADKRETTCGWAAGGRSRPLNTAGRMEGRI